MHEFQPFLMERWQSIWENRVDCNLSESGVYPLTLGELLDIAGASAADVRIGYGQSNGTAALRENIARLYSGVGIDRVCVTNGSAEANFAAMWTLVKPGDIVAVLTPTYMQMPGLASAFGARVREIPLREELGWQPDPDDVARAVTADTRMIVVTNPGNPTAALLDEASRASLISAADRTGAWILADEVYTGAELHGAETRSFIGDHDRVIATGSLSKAYGLPGLRIGWAVAPVEIADMLWARKDYTTISPGELTDHLAVLALSTHVRPRLLERTRRIIRNGWEITNEWMQEQGIFTYRPPDAGAICFARYDAPIDSALLAERLRIEKSLLIVPGHHFGCENFVRIGFGLQADDLRNALGRFGDLLSAVRQHA